ncbi:MAG: Pr6Pr family membrane protein [Candidatus Saccharimonadales bacterium]
MNKKLLVTWYRVGFALLVIAAVLAQLAYSRRHIPGFSPANFFSFFTIESNVFAAAVFLVAAKAKALGTQDRALDYLRGGATLYMVVTGIVYAILLAGTDVQTPLLWVNSVLHYIFPVAILLDWVFDRPSRKLSIKKSLLWLSFPVAYLGYSLIRGHFAHWYPYPFVNVDKLGYAAVAINSAVVAVAAVVLALVIAQLPQLRRTK